MQNKNTITDWDRLAAQSINSVLAPKGFVKMANGHWKGMEKAKSDHPFLSKRKVLEARAVAAQLVRNYRNGVKSQIQKRIGELKESIQFVNSVKLKWWQFDQRRFQKRDTEKLNAHIVRLEIVLDDLDNIEIK